MKNLHDYIAESEKWATTPMPGDEFDIELAPDHLIESYVIETLEDGIVIQADEQTMSLLEQYGCTTETIRRYGPSGSNRGVGFSVAEGIDGSNDFYAFADLFSHPNEYTHPDPEEAVRLITAQGQNPKITASNIIKFAKSNPDELSNSAVSNAVKSLMSQGVAEGSEDLRAKLDLYNEKAFEAGHRHDDQAWRKYTKLAKQIADQLGLKYKVTGYGLEIIEQGVAEGLHPMIIDDVKKLATLNPADRYSAYSNIRGYFKADPELSKMASDLMGGYYEADMLRGKYKTDAAKAKYAELEPMHQAFIKRVLGQEQGLAEEQKTFKRMMELAGVADHKFNQQDDVYNEDQDAAVVAQKELDTAIANPMPGVHEEVERETSSVARAILHRILMQHPSMLQKHGPERVMSAVEDVADFVGDVEEIGTSDVSGWIRQVLAQLERSNKQGVGEGETMPQLPEEDMDEAKYHGREVPLGKPMAGDVKKSKVYVRDPATGNIKKVNFGHGGTSAKRAGQKTMKIKKSNPARRKSFRARHNCDNPGPRTKARYWSCRAW